jgi:hypothetical protein
VIHRSLIAILAIALMTACSQQSGSVYQVPIAEARHILVGTGLPPLVFGTEEPPWDVHDGGSQVIWIVRRDDTELFRYVAHLKEENPGATRVEIELVGAQSGPGGNIAQRLAEHPAIRDMFLVAINEQIASALEHRPFETARIYPATAIAFMENMGSLRASADQAAAASERHNRENIQKAYRDEAAGR